MRQLAAAIIWLFANVLQSCFAAEAPRPQPILVLERSDVRCPFYTEISVIRDDAYESGRAPGTIYAESLDLARFPNPEYQDNLVEHFRTKYVERPIGVIVAIGVDSLRSQQRRKAALSLDMPVVFGFVPDCSGMRAPSSPGMVGTFADVGSLQMVVAAVVAPNLASVVLVGEAWKDKAIFPHWEDEIYGAAAGLAITDLSGLVMWKLRDKVASLLDRSAILYSAIYCDSEGNCYPPALSLVAKSANGPFVVACETFLGHGPIGGFAPLLDMISHDAGRFGMRIPAGVSPSTIPLTTGHDLKPLFDWRQMQRWRVAGSDLPEGSQIRLRTPTVWEQYRWQSLTALAVILAQAFLIAGMLYERRHRRKAEIEARRRMLELAHLNRQATAGEMTASIAHQLNQPLAAILSNAEAAEGLLKNPSPDLQELAEILADIRRDDERASEMIKHLRRLLRKGEFESYLFDVNDTLRDVFRFLSVPALIRGVRLETEVSPSAIYVRGDRIQLEQVVLNLVMNGIDAVADQPNERRRIIGRTEPVDGKSVLVSVADFGQGIAAEELARVFDPFFTTKEQGMGIGLSIARTIVEAHGGRIWAENQPGAGAAFHVSLPLAAAEKGQSK